MEHGLVKTLRQATLAQALFCFTALVSLCALTLVIWGFSRGLDFTDEAGNILASQAPRAMTIRLSEFAFYTHWIYNLANGDLFFFRVGGLLLLLGGACYFAWQYVALLPKDSTSIEKSTTAGIFVAVWISVLGFYCKWFPAPNYYLLCLLGLLLAAGALLHIINQLRAGHPRPWPYALLGLSLGFAALSRAPSATLMLLMLSPVLFWVHRRDLKAFLRGYGVTAACGLLMLLVHMLLVAEGLSGVRDIYVNSLLRPGSSSAGHSVPDMLASFTSAFEMLRDHIKAQAIYVVLLPLVAGALSRWGHRIFRDFSWAMVLVVALIPFSLLASRTYNDPSDVTAASFCLSFIAISLYILILPDTSLRAKLKHIVIGVGFVLLAIPEAFGSNVPLLWHASLSAIFMSAG